jgi:hypothetical protein
MTKAAAAYTASKPEVLLELLGELGFGNQHPINLRPFILRG